MAMLHEEQVDIVEILLEAGQYSTLATVSTDIQENFCWLSCPTAGIRTLQIRFLVFNKNQSQRSSKSLFEMRMHTMTGISDNWPFFFFFQWKGRNWEHSQEKQNVQFFWETGGISQPNSACAKSNLPKQWKCLCIKYKQQKDGQVQTVSYGRLLTPRPGTH